MIIENFVNKGSDENLLKSLQNDPNVDQEELQKAIDKSKLVQVEITVQGKNGTYTRKQWKRAGDVKSADKVVGGQQPQKNDKKEVDENQPKKVPSVKLMESMSNKYDRVSEKLEGLLERISDAGADAYGCNPTNEEEYNNLISEGVPKKLADRFRDAYDQRKKIQDDIISASKLVMERHGGDYPDEYDGLLFDSPEDFEW